MEIFLLVTLLLIQIAVIVFVLLRKKQLLHGKDASQAIEFRVRNTELEKRIEELQSQLNEASEIEQKLQDELRNKASEIASLTTENESLKKQAVQREEDLKKSKEELAQQFKLLSADILKEQASQFTTQNKQSVEELLKPMREHLDKFKKETEEFYIKTGKENHTLSKRLGDLLEMNNRLSEDATNLTNALKRDSKAQGNWGEVILERILESTGLQKGIHFTPQETHTNEAGRKMYPDVVLQLPEKRHLVIDSKVSLTAYERFSVANDEHSQKEALKSHLISIRKHIDELSEKDYQKLHGTASPDFVVMFIPIEPAFIQAIASDESLWQYAWKKNILLVSPSSLLFVTRIVLQLWRQEDQKENIEEIVKRGAKLYEKLHSFVTNFEKVGASIETAQKTYTHAYGQLIAGRGNAVRQAEMLKELGVETKKSYHGKCVKKRWVLTLNLMKVSELFLF
ncbi:DNA recombination protein RmuC [Chitinivibrio alkaliphilus]|uniref:RmuC domain-containing protein n=1 Tax=Chitinivibrio alkaliphilus ACht1 TaxID=1313304 RepID=U7DCC3_9BACT|nr:DNA recombination protein RmuC [Chitinivibrio alkaliphilus]ERP39223.1 RmuC domain-containing protein [Chitinivibrio alkaliphilus ACht1]